jgi:hypothetical protein
MVNQKNMTQELTLPELVTLAVHQKQIPQYLYKYRTIDSAEKLLDNNSLWFSNPEDFNDPFDCQIYADADNSEEELRELIRRTVTVPISEKAISKLASDSVNIPGKWEKILNDSIKNIMKKTGICCFAGNPSNLLMWSHYTNSHKGICLKFDILEDPDFFVFPMPVHYRTDYPHYNHLQNKDEIIKSLILSKSNEWEYEGEHRVLKVNKTGLFEFRKECLKEIIFGCRSTDDDIKKILNLANQKNYNIIFKKAEKKKREYGLDFNIIN